MSIDDIISSAEPAHAVPPPGEGTRELLAEIMATPRRPAVTPRRESPRWFRRGLAVPLVAGLAAAALVVSWLLPGIFGLGPRPAAALDIKRDGDYYIITVKDAFADPKRYESQLQDLGLDISLEVVPVSPGLEGSVFPPFDMRTNGLSIEEISRRKDLVSPIQRPGACAESFSCTIGLKIPIHYKPFKGDGYPGKARIRLGRKARPGERYQSFGQLNNPGEPLQCVRFVNKTVDQVRSLLTERGVTIAGFPVPLRGTWPSVPGSWYVQEGWLAQPGKAIVVAAPTRNRTPYPVAKNCAKGS
jgi:hypothetical protein